MRVSVKPNWVYYIEESPIETIKMTLRKFQISQNPEEVDEMAKKYRIYRVREDPKTKYRYVTEILNQEEAK